jgi:hypothetical protein
MGAALPPYCMTWTTGLHNALLRAKMPVLFLLRAGPELPRADGRLPAPAAIYLYISGANTDIQGR